MNQKLKTIEIGEIEKLIAGYRERELDLQRLAADYGDSLRVARGEALAKAGTLASVVDDLKRLA